MATVTVISPVAGFTGDVAGVAFASGRASVDRSNTSALAYFRRHGYTVDGSGPPAAESPDPRDVGTDGDGIEPVGTKLRDAAVDPQSSDFLAPTHAGEANPHGAEVVSPGVHAQPPAPIVPGPVSDNAGIQEALESGTAAMALSDNADIGDVNAAAVEAQQQVAETVEERGSELPAKSAGVQVWRDYAVALGMDGEAAEAMTKKDLLAHFGVE